MESYVNLQTDCAFTESKARIPSLEFCKSLFHQIRRDSWKSEFCEATGRLWIIYGLIKQLDDTYWMFPDIEPSLLLDILDLCSDCRTIRSLMDCLDSSTYSLSKLLTLSILNSLVPGSLSDYLTSEPNHFKTLILLCRNFRQFVGSSYHLSLSTKSSLLEIENNSYFSDYELSQCTAYDESVLDAKLCHYCLTLFEKLINEGIDLRIFWQYGYMDTLLTIITGNLICRQQALKVVATYTLFSADYSKIQQIRNCLDYSITLISYDSLEEVLDAIFYSVLIFYGHNPGNSAKAQPLLNQGLQFIQSHSCDNFTRSIDILQPSLWFDNLIDLLVQNLDIPVFAIVPFRLRMQSPRGFRRLEQNLENSQRTMLLLEKVGSMGCRSVSLEVSKLLWLLKRRVVTLLPRNIMKWETVDVKKWLSLIGFSSFTSIELRKCVPRSFNEILVKGSISELQKVLKLDLSVPCQFSRFRKEVEFLRKWVNCLVNRGSNEICDAKSSESRSKKTNMMQLSEDDRSLTHFCETRKSYRSVSLKECTKRLLFFDKTPIRPFASSTPKESPYFDVFISYRRDHGSHIASLLHYILQSRGFKSFLDVTTLNAGCFGSSIVESIKKSTNFIAILSRNALDRCYEDEKVEDYFHLEIRTAMEKDKNVVPIFLDFNAPNITRLPQIFEGFLAQNGVTWSHEYQDACIENIISFLLTSIDSELLTTPLSISSL